MVVGILCFVDLLRGWFSVASCLRLLRRIDVYNVHKSFLFIATAVFVNKLVIQVSLITVAIQH